MLKFISCINWRTVVTFLSLHWAVIYYSLKKRVFKYWSKIVHRLLCTGTCGDLYCCFWIAWKGAVIVGLFQQCCLHLDTTCRIIFFHISPKWANRGPGWTLYLLKWRVALYQLSITKCDLNLIQNRFSVNISKPVLCYFLLDHRLLWWKDVFFKRREL